MWREKDITKIYQKGDIIIKEGDHGSEMFIIKEGSVDVIKGKGDNTITLTTLKRGDFFGEMSILEDVFRSATVIAKEETHLIVLNQGSFLLKIREDQTFAFNIMKKLSYRIRVLSKKVLGQTDTLDPDSPEAKRIEAEIEYLMDYKP